MYSINNVQQKAGTKVGIIIYRHFRNSDIILKLMDII